jgi:arylsulfatase A-like enzyme
MSDDSAGYTRHLHYTDRVLGEILQTLDSTGRLDRTLLIATSDHSWRKEPDSATARLPDAGIHVPLFVKWPGQTRQLVSDSTFCHLGLWPVIQAAIAPPAPPPMTDSLWAAISATGRARRCTR